MQRQRRAVGWRAEEKCERVQECAGEAGGSPRPIVGTVDEGCGGDSTTACVQHVDEQRDAGRVESEEAPRHYFQ